MCGVGFVPHERSHQRSLYVQTHTHTHVRDLSTVRASYCVRGTRTHGPSPPLHPSSGTRSPRERTRGGRGFRCVMVCVYPVCDPSSLWPGSCHEKTESRPFAAFAKREKEREKFRLSAAPVVGRHRSIQPFANGRKNTNEAYLSCSVR